ncbi:MAG TPA: hypothetical protein VJT09_18385 [Pyrinomonadaceae bacterium]|nr:hypothetical protein [Pyrinomonadaceae bacterium]
MLTLAQHNNSFNQRRASFPFIIAFLNSPRWFKQRRAHAGIKLLAPSALDYRTDSEGRRRYRERYVPGQEIYFDKCRPKEQAKVVLDNNYPRDAVIS